MLKSPAHEVVVGKSARQWTSDGARFRVDRELNALQNGCVADVQVQSSDERSSTGRVACDRYRRVVCLVGAGEMGEDHHDGPDHD